MAGWIRGFRSAGPQASSEPQPFELVCECNLRHSGLRRKGPQRIVCRTCGVSLFVLPRDSYPPPPLAETIRKKPKARAPSRSNDPDEPAPVRVSRTKRRRQQSGDEANPLSAAAGLTSAAFAAAAGAAVGSTRATVRRVSSAGVDAAVGFWKFWTPLRLVAGGIGILLVALTLWTLHAKRVETAQKNLNPAIEEGLAALSAGDIPRAAARLRIARDALDTLGAEDEYSQSVRQAAREAIALDQLAREPLVALLEQADQAVNKAAASRPAQQPADADPPPPLDADWVVRFEALYKGGWLVLETPVHKLAPVENEPRRYRAEFPLGVGPQQRAVELRADFAVFDALGLGETPRLAVFAGRLESCRYDEAEKTYRVALEPASGFLWVNLPTYRELGFLFSDWHPQSDVEAMLAAQAKAAGVEALVKSASPTTPNLPSQ
jgi:hypothetical protein